MRILLIATLLLASASAEPARSGAEAARGLVELNRMDPSIRLDIRDATDYNFMGRVLYPQPRAFLVRPAAEALERAQKAFERQGLGVMVFDGYRPWRITKAMWDQTPAGKKQFVADPAQGSRHNRGCAVDLTLVDLTTGKPLEMPSGYDEFSGRAYSNYAGGSTRARRNRQVLRAGMEAQGFQVYPQEWWHFDFQGWKAFPILDVPFDQLK